MYSTYNDNPKNCTHDTNLILELLVMLVDLYGHNM
jgi:hypothetical protein